MSSGTQAYTAAMNSDPEPPLDTQAGHGDAVQGALPPVVRPGASRASVYPTNQPSAGRAATRPTPRPVPASGLRHTFSSLSNRDFRYLWLGLLFVMSGVQMQMIARGFLVWELTHSALMVGLVGAGGGLPMLALGLFGGAAADRVERKYLIQMGQGTSMAIALFIAVSITTETVTWGHLLAGALLQGAAWAFLMPARQAIIPQLVGREQLSNAMALNGAGMSATILLAPAVGGLLYVVIGPQGVYFVVAAAGLTALTLTSFIPRQGRSTRGASGPVLGEIRAGLSYIRKSSLVMALLVIGLVTVLLAMPFKFLLPVYVGEVYQGDSLAFGILLSMMGAGTLVGSLVIASLGRRRRGLLLIMSGCVSGIALLLVALVPYFLAAAGIMLILGLGDAGRRVLNQTLIMEQVEDKYQGRVMSVYMMNFGLMPLGILPVGLAMEMVGGRFTVGILGAALLAVFTLVLFTQKRIRDLQ